MVKHRKLPLVFLSLLLASCGAGAAAGASPSRAAWWLARDGIEPIADLINTAGLGKTPLFRDRVGSFKVATGGRALTITGHFPEANIWRFDITTFDGQFDMRRLYVEHGFVAHPDRNSIQTRRFAKLLGDPEKALTHTGPWEIFNGEWKVPTARVALDGRHVYTSWFDLPSLEDQKAGRVYASFALELKRPGRHTVRISFDDFPRHTRWRPSRRRPNKPKVTHTPNPLRPHHIGSIAVGVDERTRSLEEVHLKPELVGKHPRLSGSVEPVQVENRLGLDDKRVRDLIIYLDPDRGRLWEYSDDAESMASGNDMDAGRKGLAACQLYDRLVSLLTPEARREVDRHFLKRFEGIYNYFVFQRNYNATGYAQNHSSKTVWALVGAGLAWDGPEARRWLNWAVMVCRRRVELLGRDGGLEWMNEARDYGLGFWETSRKLITQCTGLDLAAGPFFENEWRYALHNAPAFPKGRVPVLITHHGVREEGNHPLPPDVTPEDTPTSFHFDDCDQVFMRADWSQNACRVRLSVGSVFGKKGTPKALRYNWAHCPVNRGSFVLSRGIYPIINEPGWERTYRKTAGNNNCILVNEADQWGGGQVWHPRLRLDQVGRVAFFADGVLLSVARADLRNAYPPEARIRALSRILVQLKPDHFLLFDRLGTKGRGKGEWRFHAAFVEPCVSSSRFTAFAFKRNRGKHATLEAAFTKVPDVNCQVAFLTPGVKAEVGMSDPYFRGYAFRQPMRHLRVVQESDGLMTLLTAFSPNIRLESRGRNVHVGRRGPLSWVVVVGGGAAEGLVSDGHLAIAAYDAQSRTAEVLRFGGRHLEFKGVTIPADSEDVFGVIQGGKLGRVVSSK